MAKFCKHCGAELRDGAIFCRSCGARVASAPEKPAQPAWNEPEIKPEKPVKPAWSEAEKKPRKKSKKRFPFAAVALILAGILAVEGVVAGLWFPGFFNPKKTVTVTEKEMDELVTETPNANVVSDAAVTALPDTENIGIRYSEGEINSAPAQTAKVSPDNPAADFGDVKVDFQSWNLDGEDELTVRTLKQKTDSGENGWTFSGYDFSLKSGKNKFASRVAVTIPRTASDGELGSCIVFNEDEGKWEDVYSEVSEDGRFYTFYTTHFCPGGEKLQFIVKNHKLQLNKSGEVLNLDNGIFKERYKENESRMNWAVDVDANIMWNLYGKIDKSRFDNAINQLGEKIRVDKQLADDHYVLGSLSDFFGNGYMLHDTVVVAKEFLTNLPVKSPASNYLLAISLWLLASKAESERAKGNKAFVETLWDYKGDFAATIGSAVVAAKFGNPAGLLITLGWAAINRVTSDYAAFKQTYGYRRNEHLKEGRTRDKKKATDFYNLFYSDVCRGVYFDEPAVVIDSTSDVEVDKGILSTTYIAPDAPPKYKMTATMYQPDIMEDKDYKRIKTIVNKTYDNGNYGGLYTYLTKNSNGERALALSPQWAEVFTELARIYKDDPETLDAAVEQLFWQYAFAFWKLPEEKLAAYYRACFGVGEERDNIYEYKRPKGSYIAAMQGDLVEQMKAASFPMMKEAFETVRVEEMIELEKNFAKEMSAILNTKLVFKVQDNTIGKGAPFQKSMYCVDWQNILENKDFIDDSINTAPVYLSADFITPMRFADVREVAFMPLDPTGGENDERNYYPYKSNFIPRANSKDDIVYTCTYYHYLMMGAPKEMEFLDVNGKEETVRGEIKLPEIDSSGKEVEIVVEVGEDPNLKTDKLRVSLDETMLQSSIHIYGDTKNNPRDCEVKTSSDGDVSFLLPEADFVYSYDGLISKNTRNFKRSEIKLSGKICYNTKRRKRGPLTSITSPISGGYTETNEMYSGGTTTESGDLRIESPVLGTVREPFSVTDLKESYFCIDYTEDGKISNVQITIYGEWTYRYNNGEFKADSDKRRDIKLRAD